MWVSKQALFQLTQQARYEGMQQAADSFVRGISHHYEGPDQSVPASITMALSKLENNLSKNTDFFELANSFQANLMLLADVIGDACRTGKPPELPLSN